VKNPFIAQANAGGKNHKNHFGFRCKPAGWDSNPTNQLEAENWNAEPEASALLLLESYPPKSSITKRKNQIAIPIVKIPTGNQIAQLILLGFSFYSSFLELIPIHQLAD